MSDGELNIQTFICGRCKDFTICQKNNYINLLDGTPHPKVTQNVYEAYKLLNDTRSKITLSQSEKINLPNKVYKLFISLSNHINTKEKKAMENATAPKK